jgi:hypothetical protein
MSRARLVTTGASTMIWLASSSPSAVRIAALV